MPTIGFYSTHLLQIIEVDIHHILVKSDPQGRGNYGETIDPSTGMKVFKLLSGEELKMLDKVTPDLDYLRSLQEKGEELQKKEIQERLRFASFIKLENIWREFLENQACRISNEEEINKEYTQARTEISRETENSIRRIRGQLTETTREYEQAVATLRPYLDLS